MRLAPVLLIAVAACGGGGSFSLDVLPSCPTCGTGHVLGGVKTDVKVGFAVDGARIAAFGDQHVAWLDGALATVATGDTDIDGSNFGVGPSISSVVSNPDGSAFTMITGSNRNGFGDVLVLEKLDASGHPAWHQYAVDTAVVPKTWIAPAPNGNLTVVTDSASGATITLGGTDFNGWFAIVTLSGSDGSLLATRMFNATSIRITSVAPTADGGFVIAGTIDNHLDLGGAVGDLKTITPGRTLFVARLDASGNGVWGRTWLAGGAAVIADLATDGTHVYASGTFTTSLDLGGGTTLSGTGDAQTTFFAEVAGDTGVAGWGVAATGTIAYPTIAASPKGVLIGGTYFDAIGLGSASAPAPAGGQGGVCTELVGGQPAWFLTATGDGYHTCGAVGTLNGQTYVQVGAADSSVPAAVTIDSLSLTGASRLLLDVGAAQ